MSARHALAAGLMAIPLTAHAYRIKLEHTAATPRPTDAAATTTLSVTVQRPEDEGGANPRIVGVVYGAIPIPYVIDTHPKHDQIPDYVRDWATEQLHHAGLAPTRADPTYATTVLVDRLWCEGIHALTCRGALTVRIATPDGTVRWQTSVDASTTGALTLQFNQSMLAVVIDLFDELGEELQQALSSRPAAAR